MTHLLHEETNLQIYQLLLAIIIFEGNFNSHKIILIYQLN